jgi:hypothetical protein
VGEAVVDGDELVVVGMEVGVLILLFHTDGLLKFLVREPAYSCDISSVSASHERRLRLPFR